MAHRLTPALALLGACGGHAAQPSLATANQGGEVHPAATADGSLTGPFARLELVPDLAGAPDEPPPQITALASAPGVVTVALHEVRSTMSSASCLVTLETAGGVYAGDDFLCAADRSDELVVTDATSIAIMGDTATIRFRTSYQLIGNPPGVHSYAITCTLAPTLSCTPPPAIGGYD